LDEPVPVGTVAGIVDEVAFDRLQGLGLVERRGEGLTLTKRGRFLGGGVTADLLREIDLETPAKN
jgi:hypothetical protein